MTDNSDKAIVDYTSPALCTPVTPFPPIGDAAYRQHAGGGLSHGHRQHFTIFLIKIARMVPEISSRTERHTDRHTHHNTSQPNNILIASRGLSRPASGQCNYLDRDLIGTPWSARCACLALCNDDRLRRLRSARGLMSNISWWQNTMYGRSVFLIYKNWNENWKVPEHEEVSIWHHNRNLSYAKT